MEISSKVATSFFKELLKSINEYGFDRVTSHEKETIKKMLDYDDPKLARIEETKNQVSFKKEINGYTIWLHSSYDETIKNFTKAGRVWIHVTTPRREEGEKKLYTNFFYRTESLNFIYATHVELGFLVHALSNRPVDAKKRFMELEEKPRGVFNWISVSNPKEKISFFADIPSEIKEVVLKNRNQKRYYFKVRRKKLGIKKYARDLRTVRNPRTPNNRVPVQ